jgi:16S rRNA (cytosine967-C5)-methyltransferase
LELDIWPTQLNEAILISRLLQGSSTPDVERLAMQEWSVSDASADAADPSWKAYLSAGIEEHHYWDWFRKEPPVFVRRLRPWHPGLPSPLNSPEDSHLKFAPGTSLQLAQEQGYCFVQDLGSQMSVQHKCLLGTTPIRVWDACCGAGGKSLQLLSQNQHVSLVCSDTRKSILGNLKNRFRLAQLTQPMVFSFDPLTDSADHWAGPEQFDRIILDVPCSGSGTWRRNPEERHQFRFSKLEALLPIQAQLMQKVSAKLKSGAYLIYITCSIFEKENEAQVAAFLDQHPEFELEEQGLVGGPTADADYLFRAVLKKVS